MKLKLTKEQVQAQSPDWYKVCSVETSHHSSGVYVITIYDKTEDFEFCLYLQPDGLMYADQPLTELEWPKKIKKVEDLYDAIGGYSDYCRGHGSEWIDQAD